MPKKEKLYLIAAGSRQNISKKCNGDSETDTNCA